MDFLSDVVEREVGTPVAPTPPSLPSTTGFPKPRPKSAWKQRVQKSSPSPSSSSSAREGFEKDAETGLKRLPKDQQKLDYSNLSEAEKIHLENIEILSNMSEAQRMQEREELLGTMDPVVLQKLLTRSEKRKADRSKEPDYDGYGGWIGGDKTGESWREPTLDEHAVDAALGVEKKVKFDPITVNHDDWEEVTSLDDIAPSSYQIVKEADEIDKEDAIANVHFLKPAPNQDLLDINDPDFNDKLHEKYFPDLPKDVEKLQWMQVIPELKDSDLVFDNVSTLRFDFQGDLIVPSKTANIDTSTGLHHHADTPALAGYTLGELAHLSRSTLSGQRCIAIRTLGRILHKLGKGKYNIVPDFIDEDGNVVEPDQDSVKRASTEFDQMFWGVVDELRILDTLEESADESVTQNVSVRNYAIEALWLWKQGGGNTRHAN